MGPQDSSAAQVESSSSVKTLSLRSAQPVPLSVLAVLNESSTDPALLEGFAPNGRKERSSSLQWQKKEESITDRAGIE